MVKKWQSGKLKSGKSAYFLKDNERKILIELKQRPEGIRVETIQKLTQIPKRTVYRILNKYSEKSLIQNIYPIWKIVNGHADFWQSLSQSKDIFELHNLSYIVKLIRIPDWWSRRKNYLMNLKEWQFSNHNFGKNNSNPFQQLINENFVIQTYPESIIIISRKRYFSNQPYETITQAMNDVLCLLEWFSERFKFNFFADGIPHIEIRNNDFNRIKDHLAEQCRKEGKGFLLELDKRRKVWVDYSEPFGKEANYPEGQETLEKVTKDHLLNKPLLNSELQLAIQQTNENVNNLASQMNYYGQNMVTHVEAIQTLSNSVKELTEIVKVLNKNS